MPDSTLDISQPAIIARELRRRRAKMQAAANEYYEYLEAVTHANFIRIFQDRDRELKEPKAKPRIHQNPPE